MVEPWNILAKWIKLRVGDVVSKHHWHTNEKSSLYRWAYLVETHKHADESIPLGKLGLMNEHFTEPPIPLLVGYIGQIASDPNNAGDPNDDRSNPIKSQEYNDSFGIGVAAAALHGFADLNLRIDEGNLTEPPIELLTDWIHGRVIAAAHPAGSNKWLPALDSWVDCVRDLPDEELKNERPTSLVLGYVVQVACNYKHPVISTGESGENGCRLMGELVAKLDDRSGDWHKCDNGAPNVLKASREFRGHLERISVKRLR